MQENCQYDSHTPRRRVSYDQLEALYDLLTQNRRNREVALGYNKTAEAREYSQRVWRKISTILNAHNDGAVKNWKGWCRYWVDYKSKLKKMAAATKASQQSTEDETEGTRPMTEIEEKFITFLGSDIASGPPGDQAESFKEGPVFEVSVALSEDELATSDMAGMSPPPSPRIKRTSKRLSHSRRVTYSQLKALYKCLCQNRDVALGYNKTAKAKKHCQRIWRKIATTLNTYENGAVKNWKGWCKYWSDYKFKIKRMVLHQSTGGECGETRPPCEIEQKFMTFLGSDSDLKLEEATSEVERDKVDITHVSPQSSSGDSDNSELESLAEHRRVTYRQLEALYYCLSQNRDVALGENRTARARENSQRIWKEVTRILNAHGDGAVKDWKGWCKYWVDYKSKMKKMNAAMKASHQSTEGEPGESRPMSEIEEKFMNFLYSDYNPQLEVGPSEDKRARIDISQLSPPSPEDSDDSEPQSQNDYRRVTYNQLEALYYCLYRNRDVAMGENRTAQSREVTQRKWREFSKILNAHGDGVVKNWKGWCKYWVDYKSKLKKMAAAAKASHQNTEGETGETKAMTEIEEKFLNFINSDYESGLPVIQVEPLKDGAVETFEVLVPIAEDERATVASPAPQQSPGASPSSETLRGSERVATSEVSPQDDCCRTCLGKEKLLSIFGNFGEEKMTQNLKLITGLKIKKNDGLSQKVCTKCLGTFNLLLRFRQKCREAEKTLISRFLTESKQYTQDEIKSKIDKINNENLSKFVKYKYTTRVTVKVEPDDEHNEQSVKKEYIDGNCKSDDDFEWKEDEDMKKPAKQIAAKIKMQKQRAANVIKQQKYVNRRRIPIPRGPPYRCGKCGENFDLRLAYLNHYQKHNYPVCDSCGKLCPSKATLEMHMRAKHGLEKIYSCAQCNKSFAYKPALARHERLHTGEKPFICEHCGKGFHHRDNLIQHLPLHLSQMDFQCDMCPKRVKSKKFLQIHKHNAHTGKRYRYLCSVCGRHFKKPYKVREHARRVHGVPDEQLGAVQRIEI